MTGELGKHKEQVWTKLLNRIKQHDSSLFCSHLSDRIETRNRKSRRMTGELEKHNEQVWTKLLNRTEQHDNFCFVLPCLTGERA